MNEPANHTAWVDNVGDVWVRFDEGGRGHNWWTLIGSSWVVVAQPLSWSEMDLTLRAAGPALTARALARVRQEWSR